MTEKRFAMDYGEEYHQKRIIQRCNGNTFILPHSTVVDFLNELYEENEQLKQDIEYLDEKIKENEWHWNTIDEDRDVWHYKCNQLEKENEQLKQENSDLKKWLSTVPQMENRIKELKERNQRQYERLNEITNLMFKRDWKTLELMVDEWEKEEEQLQKYGG